MLCCTAHMFGRGPKQSDCTARNKHLAGSADTSLGEISDWYKWTWWHHKGLICRTVCLSATGDEINRRHVLFLCDELRVSEWLLDLFHRLWGPTNTSGNNATSQPRTCWPKALLSGSPSTWLRQCENGSWTEVNQSSLSFVLIWNSDCGSGPSNLTFFAIFFL